MGRRGLTVAVLFLISSFCHAQQSSPEQTTGVPLEQTTPSNPGQPITPGGLLRQNQQQQASGSTPPLYHELDLLRRDGFAAARSATVSLRVLDREGLTPSGLEAADFTLTANGRQRDFRLHGPGARTTSIAPPRSAGVSAE
ncbi:MAG TPA: hypothetical protein VK670_08150 [Silvibacterium sp.]|nr:hypothetical protein [Silvibacterium sp.]